MTNPNISWEELVSFMPKLLVTVLRLRADCAREMGEYDNLREAPELNRFYPYVDGTLKEILGEAEFKDVLDHYMDTLYKSHADITKTRFAMARRGEI